ncbi:MAG: cell division protein FtsZ [Bacteroidota bacterium]|jgi:cell division protein FtsZ
MNQFENPNQSPSLFELDQKFDNSPVIKVIGVGGGGSNAVNHMYSMGIKGVDFIVCNTDSQALNNSKVPTKVQLGLGLTAGRGAGAIADVGRRAAIENVNEIQQLLADNTSMVFVTAGMGGGTGTGAAPVIAGIARELGILTVGIVTLPFGFEGSKRGLQAKAGIEEMKKNVDALLIICNDKLREIHGNLQITKAFGYADDVLSVAAKSIAEVITNTMHVNVDFADITTVMKDSGVAIMGSATAEGDNRAIRAAEAALESPLLNDSHIEGARYILLNIVSGTEEVTMDEVADINDFIQAQAGQTADIIMGIGNDPELGTSVSVTVIATGFKTNDVTTVTPSRNDDKVVFKLEENEKVAAALVNEAPAPRMEEPVAEVVNSLEPVLIIRDEVKPVENIQPVTTTIQEDRTVVYSLEGAVIETKTEVATQVIMEDLTSFVNELEEEDSMESADEFYGESYNESSEELTEELLEESDEVTPIYQELEIHTDELEFEVALDGSSDETTVTEFFFQDEVEAPVMLNLDDEPVASTVTTQAEEMTKEEEMYKRSRERILRLKELNYKMSTPGGINDLEREPAYKRRNVTLENVPNSADSNISRLTLSMDDNDRNPEIRANNSFLHDRVD